MNYDLQMKVKFCSKHKKLFESSFIKVGRSQCIDTVVFIKSWEEAKSCTKCQWKTTWGEKLKTKHYKPIWPINHHECRTAPKPNTPEPAIPQPSGPILHKFAWSHCNEHNIDYPNADGCPKCEEDEYKPDLDAQKEIIEKPYSGRPEYCHCYDCKKQIDIRRDKYLVSHPFVFGIRRRCCDCGIEFQRSSLPTEYMEIWNNV